MNASGRDARNGFALDRGVLTIGRRSSSAIAAPDGLAPRKIDLSAPRDESRRAGRAI